MASLAPVQRFRFFTAGSATSPVMPLVFGKVWTYEAGTTTPKFTYTNVGETPGDRNTNPIILDARGEANIWLGAGAYKFIVTDALDVQQGGPVDNIKSMDQWLTDSSTAIFADLANTADVTKNAALVGFKSTAAGSVATTLKGWADRQQLDTYANFGIVPDGADRTGALVALMATLGGAAFRGWVHIPYGTMFDLDTVWAAVPAGVVLDDESSINWGHPPAYKNKDRVMYSGDLAADDTRQTIASGHHPALMLLNMGTAGTSSGDGRFATILHGVGRDYADDPMLGWIWQFKKDPAQDKWLITARVSTDYAIAIANPQLWAAATIYAAGEYCISDTTRVYQTTAGGTSGGVAPTGTGTGINDGGVLWNYVQSDLALDSTRWTLDEDGTMNVYGSTAGFRATAQGQSKDVNLVFTPTDSSSAEAPQPFLRWNATAGLQIMKSDSSSALVTFTDTGGTNHSETRSTFTLAASGDTTPTVNAIGTLYLVNAGATSITTLDDPSDGQLVTLVASNGNTTLIHSANFMLEGSVNVVMTAGSVVKMLRVPTSLSANLWLEDSRSIK